MSRDLFKMENIKNRAWSIERNGTCFTPDAPRATPQDHLIANPINQLRQRRSLAVH